MESVDETSLTCRAPSSLLHEGSGRRVAALTNVSAAQEGVAAGGGGDVVAVVEEGESTAIADPGPQLLMIFTIFVGTFFCCSVICVMRGTGSMPRILRMICRVVDN